MTEVHYLDDPKDITEMVLRFQSGKVGSVTTTIKLEMIHRLSELVVFPPSLIRDQLLFIKFGQAACEYRQQRSRRIEQDKIRVVLPEISDRRIAVASQMMEAAAVLDGRLIAEPKDLLACADALGTTDVEHALWCEIAGRKIEEIRTEKGQQLDHAQLVAVQSIIDQAEAITASANGDTHLAIGELKALRHNLSQIVPDGDEVTQRVTVATGKLGEIEQRLRTRVLAEAGLE